jgi:hypothetical protein
LTTLDFGAGRHVENPKVTLEIRKSHLKSESHT